MRIENEDQMLKFAIRLAKRLQGNEMIELVGDVGAGKTTFTKGLARGLGIDEMIQSPTFTISREYLYGDDRHEKRLVHYDFYRLTEAGIMRDELAETIDDNSTITVVEWADVTKDVLPEKRLTITIKAVADDQSARDVELSLTPELAYCQEIKS